MSTEQQRPPLWKILREAYDCSTAPSGNSDDWTERDGFSAEIRALRDWLVPEEGDVVPDGDLTEQAYRSDERFGLRALLTTEAERAERGE